MSARAAMVLEAPPAGGVGRKLAWNAIANFAGKIAFLLFGVITTPYLIHHFGSALYGILMLLWTFVDLMNAFQLGLNVSVIKYVAASFESGAADEIHQYVGTALTLFFAMGLVALVGILVCMHFHVLGIFNPPARYAGDAQISLLITGIAVLVRFLAEPYSAVPMAAQRFDIVNCITIGSELVRVVGTVLAIWFGYLLKSVVTMALLSSILYLLGMFLAARHFVPGLTLVPAVSRVHLRRICKFTRFVALQKLSSRIGNNLDTLLVGYFLPVRYLAFYAVSSSIAYQSIGLIGNVTSACLPAFSVLAVSDPSRRLKSMYIGSSKAAAAIAGLPAVAFCVLGAKILHYWISPEFAAGGALLLLLLSAGAFVNCLMHVPSSLADALGLPKVPATCSTVSTCFYLACCALLLPRFGLAGIGLAYLGTQLLCAPVFIATIGRIAGVGWRSLLSEAYLPLAPALAAAGLTFAAVSPLVTSLAWLALAGVAGALVFAAMAWIFTLGAAEREFILTTLNNMRCRVFSTRHIAELSQ